MKTSADRKYKYDYLVVGAGLYGAVFTNEALKAGKNCLVIDRRPHIAGNIYTERRKNIHVHKYGAHIFHTSNRQVWDYVRQFGEFNNFVNSPVAVYKDEVYNLPFNMNTFNRLWGVRTPEEARKKRAAGDKPKKNGGSSKKKPSGSAKSGSGTPKKPKS